MHPSVRHSIRPFIRLARPSYRPSPSTSLSVSVRPSLSPSLRQSSFVRPSPSVSVRLSVRPSPYTCVRLRPSVHQFRPSVRPTARLRPSVYLRPFVRSSPSSSLRLSPSVHLRPFVRFRRPSVCPSVRPSPSVGEPAYLPHWHVQSSMSVVSPYDERQHGEALLVTIHDLSDGDGLLRPTDHRRTEVGQFAGVARTIILAARIPFPVGNSISGRTTVFLRRRRGRRRRRRTFNELNESVARVVLELEVL